MPYAAACAKPFRSTIRYDQLAENFLSARRARRRLRGSIEPGPDASP